MPHDMEMVDYVVIVPGDLAAQRGFSPAVIEDALGRAFPQYSFRVLNAADWTFKSEVDGYQHDAQLVALPVMSGKRAAGDGLPDDAMIMRPLPDQAETAAVNALLAGLAANGIPAN